MVWFKVDDQLAMHMKAFAAGNAALGLWVRAGSWSMQQLTDGFIPQGVVAALGGVWDDAAALVNCGLWDQADGGYRFHDWAEYQPTRDQVLAEREAAAERMRRVRANKQANIRANDEANERGTNAERTAFVQAPRPVPSPDSSTYVQESSYVGNRARETDETAEASRSVLTGLGVNPDRLVGHIKNRTGRDVTLTTAMRIATDVLAKGGEVKHPQAYVLGSITKSWAEVQQFIDENGIAS